LLKRILPKGVRITLLPKLKVARNRSLSEPEAVVDTPRNCPRYPPNGPGPLLFAFTVPLTESLPLFPRYLTLSVELDDPFETVPFTVIGRRTVLASATLKAKAPTPEMSMSSTHRFNEWRFEIESVECGRLVSFVIMDWCTTVG